MKAVIYKGKDKKWYCKILAKNGKNVWDTGDGYQRRIDAVKAVEFLNKNEFKIIFK